ncbi:hypothetical protein ACFOSC_13165 [Streptantibioticus rubrisoli]|uniref:Uncharacterized protein n=1 Tax=Streptantibioticus rubrisoli TaxID=1387313 RepID=A0ABT1P7S2_9ACTN|nr:hypothetical protein [Streptantibioticus rubrisoli]MCQ4041421.1 hypothetical protein [Streptantibioticus rubrisoli]
MTAKRVLIAQAVLAGAAALVILAKEFPGLVREVRIWRMADLKSGSRHPS